MVPNERPRIRAQVSTLRTFLGRPFGFGGRARKVGSGDDSLASTGYYCVDLPSQESFKTPRPPPPPLSPKP